MPAQQTSNNVVVNLISMLGTTEGSTVERFLREIESIFPAKEALTEGLKEMTGIDAEILCDQSNGIGKLLRILDKHDRDLIVHSWLKSSALDSKLAVELVRWIVSNQLHVSADEFNQLIDFAKLEFIHCIELRNQLRVWFGNSKHDLRDLEFPTELTAALRQDELDDLADKERNRELIRQSEIERSEYLDSLNCLTFYEKLKALRFGRKVYFSDLQSKPNFLAYTERDLVSLNAMKIQQLIDWCSSDGFYWQEILPKLFERRHQLRLDAMNQVRENLKVFPVECWLNELLLIESIPIEHYPVELTDHATTKWFASLDPDVGMRFLDLLKSTKLRVWKKVEARLTAPKV